jgi:molybdopterin molybdotransferase
MPSELIEIDVARAAVLERISPVGAEEVPIREALGRVLAERVKSADAVPAFDNSAMDGYAVRAADTAGASPSAPVSLALVGESRAGRPAERSLERGEAIAISTGAMIPTGADAVIRVEDTSPAVGRVEVHVAAEPGHDLRRAGEDIRPGDVVVEAGAQVGSAEIGVLASVGRSRIACARRPAVHLLTTGDELQEPDEPLRPGGVRNSNAHSVPALIERAGGLASAVETVPDDPRAIREALERALTCDLAVVCGGMSVGEHDHVRPALAELGVEQLFWGVALRPGKPTWFGVRDRALVFGLPGNPVSAMVTFLVFVRPAIRAMLGARGNGGRTTTAIIDADYPKRPGRAHLVRCRLELRDDGWHVTPTKEQGSHVLSSMVGAEALAVLPTESETVGAGDRVEIVMLS